MPPAPPDIARALERASGLDRLVAPVRQLVGRLPLPSAARNLLHGVPLGHPLHPMLTDVAVGCLVSGSALDVLGHDDAGPTLLLAAGSVAAVPTALSGLLDWADAHEQQQRVGLVHALANSTALSCYLFSLGARLGGRRAAGRAWSVAGLAALTVGGYLGGHLSYALATGANHAEHLPHRFPPGWVPAGSVADLPDNQPVGRSVAGSGVVLVRRGGRVHALGDTCAHLSGPLSEGAVEELAGEACLRCPWHGSLFRLVDGKVMRGPATSSQPVFQTRLDGDRLDVALPDAG